MGQEHSTISSTSPIERKHTRQRQKHESGRKRSQSESSGSSRSQQEPGDRTPSRKSVNYSSESSGYRSCSEYRGSSSSSSSGSSDYYHLPLYKNSHYQDINSNIYRPIKISKTKLDKLKFLDSEKERALYLEKHLSIKSYLQHELQGCQKIGPRMPEPTTVAKKCGIRNYTPKILEGPNEKTIENWV